MSKPKAIGRPTRDELWKKFWGKIKPIPDEDSEAAFDEFVDEFVPTHMHKTFLKSIGDPKVHFQNRAFRDDASFHPLDTPLYSLLRTSNKEKPVDVTLILPSGDTLPGFALRGPARRTLRQIVIDDWHTSIAIAKSDSATLYIFVQPKMKGAIVRNTEPEPEEELDDRIFTP